MRPGSAGVLDISLQLPWSAVLSAGPLLKEWGLDLAKAPVLSQTAVHFQYKEGKAAFSARGESPPFAFHAEQFQEEWKIDLQSDLVIQAVLQKEGSVKGKGSWKAGGRRSSRGRSTLVCAASFLFPRCGLI